MKTLYCVIILVFVASLCHSQDVQPVHKTASDSSAKKTGLCNIISASMMVPTSNNLTNPAFPGFKLITGVQIHNIFVGGVGLGIDIYSGTYLIPVTADISFTPVKGNASPLIMVSSGYAFIPSGELEGQTAHSILFEADLGGRFRLNKYITLLISGGYRMEGITATSSEPVPIFGYNNNQGGPTTSGINTIVFKLGLQF
jgi:hypothetical protein